MLEIILSVSNFRKVGSYFKSQLYECIFGAIYNRKNIYFHETNIIKIHNTCEKTERRN